MRAIVVLLSLISLLSCSAKDLDVLIYSAEPGDTAVLVDDMSIYLNEMLSRAEGFSGSSAVRHSAHAYVDSLMEGYHDPQYQSTTLSLVRGDYDAVVLVPSYWFIRRYPEMCFEGVYQLSREILEAGAEPILLMADSGVVGEVSSVGEHVYRIANGCGIHANPAGYALETLGLIAPAYQSEADYQQAYVMAASLFTQITGLNAADLDYAPVANSTHFAQAAYDNWNAHQSSQHYTGARVDGGVVRYRYLDLDAAPFYGVARFAYKGTSTEAGLSSHMSPILQANGYSVEAKKVSSNTDSTKDWVDADFELAKPHYAARDDQMFLTYARGSQSGAAQMITYDQANLIPLTFDRHFDDIGTGLQSTQNMLDDVHVRSWAMFIDHYYQGWNTVPYHVGVGRLYQADPTVIASTDGVHATAVFYNLLASMVLTSTLGQELQPSAAIQGNSQSLLAFNIGKQMIRQMAQLSESEAAVPDSTLTVLNSKLGVASTGNPYSVSLEAEGGSAPYTWELISSGGLPDGLSLTNDGVLAGTPASDAAGTYTLVVKVTDADGAMRKRAVQLFIGDASSPSYSAWAEFMFDDSGYASAEQLSDADPEGDGVSNFEEFAFGTDPVLRDTSRGLSWSFDSDSAVALSFVRGQGHLRYWLESTQQLTNWTNPVVHWDSDVNVEDLVAVGGLQVIELERSSELRRFYRLKLED